MLSPFTRKRDRHGKRPVYLAHGVGEVWLVDDATRTVERWTAASEFPRTLYELFTWTPDAASPSMIMTADELFGPALDTESTPAEANDDD
ncbi:Uma2 family endonuclease [Gemmatimonas sp.]|uniref:Uma2 family endonuclease n=1 Tax=Gemmatimonas sp. TaxID=1962908 RepID=UPI003566E019